MYEHPLDFSVANAPFVFRQISAVLTYGIYKLGFYYPNGIMFNEAGYDQRIFFAALFSNYLCLVATAWIAGLIVSQLTGSSSLTYQLMAGFLCFLSFHVQSVLITGLTEGASWLLMTAAFLAYIKRNMLILMIILLVSVLQRETILIAFASIAFMVWILEPTSRRYNGGVFIWSIICFAAYLSLRKFTGVTGYEQQMQVNLFFNQLVSFHFTKEILTQVGFSQNVFFIYMLLALVTFKAVPEQRFWMPVLLFAITILFLVGVVTGIGNNMGRICGIFSPIFASFACISLLRMDEGKSLSVHTTQINEGKLG